MESGGLSRLKSNRLPSAGGPLSLTPDSMEALAPCLGRTETVVHTNDLVVQKSLFPYSIKSFADASLRSARFSISGSTRSSPQLQGSQEDDVFHPSRLSGTISS